MDKDRECIQEARNLLQAAHDSGLKFEEQVERILLEISKVGIANGEPLAKLAVEETGCGTVAHKTLKNLICAEDVYLKYALPLTQAPLPSCWEVNEVSHSLPRDPRCHPCHQTDYSTCGRGQTWPLGSAQSER